MGGVTFHPTLAKLVLADAKTETRRLLSDNPRSPWFGGGCRLRRFRDYAVQPGRGKPQIGRLLVVERPRRSTIGQMGTEAAQREGCVDLTAFNALWEALNGPWDPETEVWVIRFVRLTRYRVAVPAVGLGRTTWRPADDLDEVRALMAERGGSWAVDNQLRRRVYGDGS